MDGPRGVAMGPMKKNFNQYIGKKVLSPVRPSIFRQPQRVEGTQEDFEDDDCINSMDDSCNEGVSLPSSPDKNPYATQTINKFMHTLKKPNSSQTKLMALKTKSSGSSDKFRDIIHNNQSHKKQPGVMTAERVQQSGTTKS
jgi:hypothetical protein